MGLRKGSTIFQEEFMGLIKILCQDYGGNIVMEKTMMLQRLSKTKRFMKLVVNDNGRRQ